MTNQTSYPPDEFDELGAHRVPQGVHRAPASKWRPWIPFFVVVLIAPILGYALVKGWTDGENSPEVSPTTSQMPTDGTSDEPTEEPGASESGEEPGEGPSEEPSEGPSQEPSDEPSDSPSAVELDYQAPVSVLNGAGVQGLAGRTADRLSDLGWQNTEAGNYQSAQPTTSMVFHPGGEFEDEAREIAESLGIESVIGDSAAAPNSIIVVLRSDFSE